MAARRLPRNEGTGASEVLSTSGLRTPAVRVSGRGGGPPADPATMTPRQQERRERLIEAGLALLDTRDYDGIQVKDVAEQAGVALGTLYNYFSSKEHLFAEVLISWASILKSSVSRRPLKEGTTSERLTEVFHRGIRGFQRQPQMARLVSALDMSQDVFASEILQRLQRTTSEAYLPVLRHLPESNARGIIRVVNSVLSTNLRDWSVGRKTIVDCYDNVAEAVRLLLDSNEASVSSGG